MMLVVLALFVSCATTEEKGWTLNGTINGYGDGEITTPKSFNDENAPSYPIKDGKFTIKGDALTEPLALTLQVKNTGASAKVYIENGVTTFEADFVTGKREIFQGRMEEYQELNVKKVEGSIINEHYKAQSDYASAQYAELDKHRTTGGFMDDNQMRVLNEIHTNITNYNLDFIRKNPNAYFSGELVCNNLSGKKDKSEIQGYINMLGSELKHTGVKNLQARLNAIKDVDVSEVITASNVSYEVDNSYDGSAYKNAKYLAVLTNDNLVTLNNDKTISVIDSKGKKINTFTVSNSTVPSTMAVDESNNIYVMVPVEEMVEATFRGKKVNRKEIVGYNCDVYNTKGDKLRSMTISDVKEATGARVAGGKLMVADMSGRDIDVFNAETGVRESAIANMRPCCGILDFDINDKNEILVANLGAFRVQKFKMSGEQILSFGSRGDDVSKFHGCCNPVSIAYLSNGAIVTVEKDPTRVKVFSKEGAIAIKGIDEMVKGCSYIPMTVDAKDNLYLASPTKGVVKCISI